jgi:hypothetical protein
MVISTGTVLIVVLLILLIGGLPAWPHSKSWGYAPTGIFSTLLVILLILVLMGRL